MIGARLTIVVVWTLFMQGNALICHSGLRARYTIANIDTIDPLDCGNDQQSRCLRVEGTMNVESLFGQDAVPALYVSCSNRAECAQNCRGIVETQLAEFDIGGLTLSVRDCEKACCNSDNCNSDSVQQIESRQRETTTGPRIAEETSKEDATSTEIKKTMVPSLSSEQPTTGATADEVSNPASPEIITAPSETMPRSSSATDATLDLFTENSTIDENIDTERGAGTSVLHYKLLIFFSFTLQRIVVLWNCQ